MYDCKFTGMWWVAHVVGDRSAEVDSERIRLK